MLNDYSTKYGCSQARYDLALLLCVEHKKTPERILKGLFDESMKSLNLNHDFAAAKHPDLLRDFSWKEEVDALNAIFIGELLKKVLCHFEEKEVESMLEEFKRLGLITNQLNRDHLFAFLNLNWGHLVVALVTRAQGFKSQFLEKIKTILNQQGIFADREV